jgi:hypothetical protein
VSSCTTAHNFFVLLCGASLSTCSPSLSLRPTGGSPCFITEQTLRTTHLIFFFLPCGAFNIHLFPSSLTAIGIAQGCSTSSVIVFTVLGDEKVLAHPQISPVDCRTPPRLAVIIVPRIDPMSSRSLLLGYAWPLCPRRLPLSQ